MYRFAGPTCVTLVFLLTAPSTPSAAAIFVRGNTNQDSVVDISDAISIFGHLFLGEPAELLCKDTADTNDDGGLDVSDGIYLLNFLFLGGPPLPPPYPDCGIDATPSDPLDCAAFTGCPDIDEFKSLLDEAGINPDEAGGPVDSDGNELPQGYNPLGPGPISNYPIKELFAAGFYHSNYFNRNQAIIDRAKMDSFPFSYYWDPLYASTDQTFEDAMVSADSKACIGADVDGDGLDEIIIVWRDTGFFPQLRLKVIDYNHEAPTATMETGGVIPITTTALPVDFRQYQPSIAKGDLDKDGRDEVVVAYGHVYIFDDIIQSPFATATNPWPGETRYHVHVATGDIDRDGQEELAITSSDRPSAETGVKTYCDVFGFEDAPDLDLNNAARLLGPGFVLQNEKMWGNEENPEKYSYACYVLVKMGDIDGDRHDELVFYGVGHTPHNSWNLTAMKYYPHTAPDTGEKLNFKWLDFFAKIGDRGETSQGAFCLLNYNNDGCADIFASNFLLNYTGDASCCQDCENWRSQNALNKNVTLVAAKEQDYFVRYEPYKVWAGDIDGDFKDEIAFVRGDVLYICDVKMQDSMGFEGDLEIAGVAKTNPMLCFANVDDDSSVFEYTGKHVVQWSQPIVTAVLAAPPYYEGVNEQDSYTAYAESVGEGQITTQSVGVKAGFSVGYEEHVPGVGGGSVKATLEVAMDRISTAEREVQSEVLWASKEDSVLLNIVPFDVFEYKIISGPNAEKESENFFTINVPRRPRPRHWTVEKYNRLNGDLPDIMFQHTMGVPGSYPGWGDGLLTSEPCETGDSIDDRCLRSGEATTGITFTEVAMTVSNVASEGVDLDLDVGVEFEANFGGFTTGGSYGFHYGMAYTVKVSRSTKFYGRVGAEIGENDPYSFWLVAYPVRIDYDDDDEAESWYWCLGYEVDMFTR